MLDLCDQKIRSQVLLLGFKLCHSLATGERHLWCYQWAWHMVCGSETGTCPLLRVKLVVTVGLLSNALSAEFVTAVQSHFS